LDDIYVEEGHEQAGFQEKEDLGIHEERVDEILIAAASVQPSSILDVGCGWGYVTKRLIAAGYQVAGLDISEDRVEYCQGQGIEAKVRNFHKKVLSEKKFDLAIASELFEHSFFPHRLAENLSHVCKKLLVTTPKNGGVDHRCHLAKYTPELSDYILGPCFNLDRRWEKGLWDFSLWGVK